MERFLMQIPRLCLSLIVATVLTATPSIRSADPPLDSPEERVLDKWLGSWRTSYKLLKAEWTPDEKTVTAEVTTSRVVGGRFVQEKSEHSDRSSGSLMLTYDAQMKCYRGWWFSSAGHTNEFTGEWDAGTKTMTWTSKQEANTSTTKHRIVDDDNLEWAVIVKDGTGKLLFHSEGKSVRVKQLKR
jgi:hypothetical protein